MADLVDEVFGNIPVEPEPAPDPTPEPQVEPVAPEPIAEAPQVEQPQEDTRHVPLPTLLDERDRRKSAERERDEFKRKFEESQVRQPQALPDPYDDPDGYTASLEAKLEQRLVAQRFEISDQLAREKHGDETVEAAVAWAKEKAQADPTFAAGYMQDKNPINWIVAQHKRDALVSALPNDVSSLDELIEREIAKRGLSAPAPALVVAAPTPAVKPPAPPRSIANDAPAPSAVSDPSADFMAIFDKR